MKKCDVSMLVVAQVCNEGKELQIKKKCSK